MLWGDDAIRVGFYHGVQKRGEAVCVGNLQVTLDTVEWEICVCEYFRYFLEMTFCLNYIFAILVAQHVGSVCMAAYLITSKKFIRN